VRAILVIKSGPLTTIQDLGRRGLAHLAVPPSGALDHPAFLLGNRLVGNREDAAALEVTFSSFSFRSLSDCVVAVTGAKAELLLDGKQEPWGMPIVMSKHQVLEVSSPRAGVRTYVAFSGGIETDTDLGSRSTDILSSLGPNPIRDGQVLVLGETVGTPPVIDFAPYPEPKGDIRLDLYLGPRDNYLVDSALRDLADKAWRVSSNSNRIALKLEGPKLAKKERTELKSEGIVIGSVQVPHDGLPLIFLADHPTTGGYPVVGVVDPSDVAACAQAAPGTRISFRVIRDHWSRRS
jgi:biotin-dependent carboxylase-like uncharacterized protein